MEAKMPLINASSSNSTNNVPDNTSTFMIGFGILLIFVMFGILASAFLCFTLKKDPYLWESEQEKQMEQNEDDDIVDDASSEKNKINFDSNSRGVNV